MGQAAFTMNLPKEKQGFFLRMPMWFGAKGKKITPVARALAARVFGVSKSKKEKELWTSYDQIEAELGVCRRSVASSVGKLKDAALISESNRSRNGTSYMFTGETGNRYDIIPLYLYTADVTVGGIERRLTKAQVLLLGHMMTEAKRPKNDGKVEGSMALFARKLNLSETTVKKGIKVLLKAGLIYRTAEDKGVNGSQLSYYRVNKSLFEYEKMRRVKAPKKTAAEKAIAAVDARAEREAYYQKRQQEMQARAERYLMQAYKRAPKLKDIEVELRRLEIALVKAERRGGEEIKQLQLKERSLKVEHASIYKEIGADIRLTKADFYARCKKCSDKGYLPSGRYCTCYLGGDRE